MFSFFDFCQFKKPAAFSCTIRHWWPKDRLVPFGSTQVKLLGAQDITHILILREFKRSCRYDAFAKDSSLYPKFTEAVHPRLLDCSHIQCNKKPQPEPAPLSHTVGTKAVGCLEFMARAWISQVFCFWKVMARTTFAADSLRKRQAHDTCSQVLDGEVLGTVLGFGSCKTLE